MTSSNYEILLDIRDRHGELTPEIVVEEASNVTSPLHNCFEWDDATAAHGYRLEQARRLIRSAMINRLPTEDSAPSPESARINRVRGFISLRNNEGRSTYEPTQEVALDPIKREMALQDMERDWNTLRRKWATMQGAFESMVRASLEEN